MRTAEDILRKVRKLCAKKLAERKEAYLSRSYLNCKYNERHRVRKNGMIGFCTNDAVKDMTRKKIVPCCDEDEAEGCNFFICKNTEESIISEFNDVLRNPARCGSEYPQIAALLWVLQEDQEEGVSD